MVSMATIKVSLEHGGVHTTLVIFSAVTYPEPGLI